MQLNRCKICDKPIDNDLTLTQYNILVNKPFDKGRNTISEMVETSLCVGCGVDWLSVGLGEMHGRRLQRWVARLFATLKRKTIRKCYERIKLGIIGRKKRRATSSSSS